VVEPHALRNEFGQFAGPDPIQALPRCNVLLGQADPQEDLARVADPLLVAGAGHGVRRPYLERRDLPVRHAYQQERAALLAGQDRPPALPVEGRAPVLLNHDLLASGRLELEVGIAEIRIGAEKALLAAAEVRQFDAEQARVEAQAQAGIFSDSDNGAPSRRMPCRARTPDLQPLRQL